MTDPVLETVRQWSQRGVDFALVTVVGVRGSTYRGLGARQVISADGTSVGSVSGGCLDSALHDETTGVIAEGRARIVSFDLSSDDDEIWGWGIGCNGVTEVLIEPAQGAVALADLIEAHESRLGVLIHALGPEPTRTVRHGSDDEFVDGDAAEVLADRRHRRIDVDGAPHFFEVVGAAPTLVVCGAGHDAVPVVRYASEVGFDVTVVDDRSSFLDQGRFPEAVSLVNCRPSELPAAVDLGPGTSVVIMSHNYLRDLDYLGAVLGTEVDYIGTLGPGRRLQRLLNDLVKSGVAIPDRDRERLYGPAGLDIGADGPRQIAMAVVSEVLAVRNGLGGGSLRDRKGITSSRRPVVASDEREKVR